MSWVEVAATFEDAPPDWSPLIDIFLRHGCENTLQSENPPTLSSAVVDVAGADRVVAALKMDLLAAGARAVDVRPLEEVNWEENWKQFFKPRRVGRRFVVRPTWESVDLGPDDLEIVLDPGQAFGTGDHATTRMCLELIEESVEPESTVADVGCGSGILTVGAAKLGAHRVVAVDIDPLSVEVARENAAMNGVQFEAIVGAGVQALPSSGWPTPDATQYDVVVSNIISATLIAIAGEVANVVRQGGLWIVSGIIAVNWPDVLEAANRSGFELERRMFEDEWVAARFRRVG